MISNSEFIKVLGDKCLKSDKINGEIKFHFIIKILTKMNIIDSKDLNDCEDIILPKLFKEDSFTPISSIIPRYNNEYNEYEKIGSGAFGNVFIAQHYLDNNLYAIKKILIPENQINDINNAISEILILSRLNHPNIVRYYNSWMEPYIFKNNKDENDFDLLNNYILSNNDNETRLIESNNYNLIAYDKNDNLLNNYMGSNNTIEKKEMSNNLSIIEFNHKDSSGLESTSNSEGNNIIDFKDSKSCILFYIQMELCEKMTLEDILKQKNINTKYKINILKQIISATKYLHDNNIIHRDIKPKNILFSKDNILKLSDFGLSIFNNNTNYMNSSKGTFLYRDPFFNNKLMDIYSIGIIITEMFCNFETQMERYIILSKLRDNHIPDNIPNSLINIINCCITDNVEKRYDINKLEKIISNYNNKYLEELQI